MKRIVPKSCFFVSALCSFFPKQLMAKSETHFGFKKLESYEYIKRKISSNKSKFQKVEIILSPSLLYLHDVMK